MYYTYIIFFYIKYLSAAYYMDDFINNLLSTKKEKNKQIPTVIDSLYKKPNKEKPDDKAHFEHINKDMWQQADLLFLPNDKGFQYCLVIVDIGSRKCDAVPLQSKNTIEVLKAFQTIYKRSILAIPKQLTCDSGTEFQGQTAIGLEKLGININYGVPGSHRMLALVERKNQTIGTIIHKLIVHDQIVSGNDTSQWIEALPKIITAINKKVEESKVTANPEWPKNKNYVIDLLTVGDKVRVLLENPQDLNGNTLHGKFRSSDIRWNPTVRTIKFVIDKPGQPFMYLLDGDYGPLKIQQNAYTRSRLQLVTDKEITPNKTILQTDDKEKRFEFEKIIGERTVNGVKEFLVKWKHYSKKESTYELRSELIKDIPQAVKKYELKNK